MSHVNRPPTAPLTMLAALHIAAIGIVNERDESYRKGARMNILRILGNLEAMVDSASRLVFM
jgi:hypothetical protein